MLLHQDTTHYISEQIKYLCPANPLFINHQNHTLKDFASLEEMTFFIVAEINCYIEHHTSLTISRMRSLAGPVYTCGFKTSCFDITHTYATNILAESIPDNCTFGQLEFEIPLYQLIHIIVISHQKIPAIYTALQLPFGGKLWWQKNLANCLLTTFGKIKFGKLLYEVRPMQLSSGVA